MLRFVIKKKIIICEQIWIPAPRRIIGVSADVFGTYDDSIEALLSSFCAGSLGG